MTESRQAIPDAIPLCVVGVDFRRAPARQRDRLVLSAEERSALAQEIRRSEVADGLASLDTCNRTEWIVSAIDPGWAAEVLRTQMILRGAGDDVKSPPSLALVPYVFVAEEAARHLLKVAAGLESFVVGEKEIAGQLHRALERSRTEQTGSPILNGLGKAVGRLTRDTHPIELTGKGPRGVHDLVVDFLLRRLPQTPQVVVVGGGQIAEKVLRSLRGAGLRPTLCNRTTRLGWAGQTAVFPLDRLPELLEEADAAVVCTAAPRPIVTRNQLGPRLTEKPLLLVDLGIPAQVDPTLPHAVAEQADLETLQEAAGNGVAASWADLVHVRQRVDQAVAEFRVFCQERQLTLLLKRTQERHQRYIRVEIPRALDCLPDLPPGDRNRLESELKGLVRRYTNAVFTDIRELIQGETEE